MTILMIALGSAGDVHPSVGLGLEMQRRGHRVILVAPAVFEELAARVGLEFSGVGTREAFEAALHNPDLWHPTRAFRVVARGLMIPAIGEIFTLIERFHREGDLLVTAPATALGARVAQEALGVPLVTIHLQPSMLRSVYQNPVYSLPDLSSWAPPFLKRWFFHLVDRWMIDPLLLRDLNAFRARFGLAPIRRVFHQWMHSPELTLGLFPSWYAPIQPDWPSSVQLTGFPLYDERGAREIPSALEEFLSAGDPPVVFTAGSAMTQGQRFFSESLALCEQLRIRGILLAQHAEQIPPQLPPSVRHFPYVPFSQVLPRVAALVHHGGIGTTAQALAAGVPQLVVAMAHDQPDNGIRVRRLGVGDCLPAWRYSARTARPLLERLFEEPSYRQHATRLASALSPSQAIASACDAIEAAGARRGLQARTEDRGALVE
jgi:UDP:flavonoid glycosyltransferase YjiC (YdhE family)